MQKERGTSRSLSLHEEIEREAREIKKEMERHPELDDIQVTEEMDAALLEKIRDYEEELEEEREAVKKVEENLRKGRYLTTADEERAAKRGGMENTVRRFKVPGDSVEFAAELMPEIPREFLSRRRGAEVDGEAGISVSAEAGTAGERMAGLSDEETAARMGDMVTVAMEEAGEGKMLYRRKKRKYFVVSLVAVLVIVMGVGVTSVGSKSHWKVLWESVTGRPMNGIDTEDMSSADAEDIDEIAVYSEITEKLNINPVRIVYKPDDMKLIDYEIQEEIIKVQLLYKYKNEIIRYFLYMNDEDASIGQNEEDNKLDEYTVSTNGIDIKVEEYKVSDSLENRQIANFEYKDIHYQLKGVLEKSEFKKILENLYFY